MALTVLILIFGKKFWAAYVPCGAQYLDAVKQTLEQVDLIKRLVDRFPNYLRFAVDAKGKPRRRCKSETNYEPRPAVVQLAQGKDESISRSWSSFFCAPGFLFCFCFLFAFPFSRARNGAGARPTESAKWPSSILTDKKCADQWGKKRGHSVFLLDRSLHEKM